MKVYDVIIIGAGPAGLMAANELRKKTDNFLVIDSKKEIGKPLKCGEGIRKSHFIELFNGTNYDFIKNQTNFIEVNCGKTKRTLNVNYLMLDRTSFEKWLSPPEKYIKLQTTCTDIHEKKDYMEVLTRKDRLKTKLVILAYGCKYFIQKKFNLIDKIPITIPCYGGIFRNNKMDKKTLYFFFDDYKKTGHWIFPKGYDYVNSGTGIYPVNNPFNLKKALDQQLNKFSLKGKPTYAGVYPTTGPIKKTYTKRMLVCGNAAGQVVPGTGEGIYFALKSGQLAATTCLKKLQNKESLSMYEIRWKKSFGNYLDSGKLFAELLYFGMDKKILQKMSAIPTSKELKNMFIEGKKPIRARIAHSIAKLLDKSKIL